MGTEPWGASAFGKWTRFKTFSLPFFLILMACNLGDGLLSSNPANRRSGQGCGA